MIAESPPSDAFAPDRNLLPSAGAPSSPSRLLHTWDAASLARLVDALAASPAPRLGIADLPAWDAAISILLDPTSARRRALDRLLTEGSGLSPEGLQAGLESALGGWTGATAERLVREASGLPTSPEGLVLVVLASNLPGLAAQALLPALALGRRVLLKSPGAEPFFAPALLQELEGQAPELVSGRAAAVWCGGDRLLEDPLLERAATVLAYGSDAALHDLRSRSRGRFLGFGPRISLAILGRDLDPETLAPRLARDVALFDQRGCLSIHAVLVLGDARPWLEPLGRALAERAETWPPGPAELPALAEVRGLREEAALRGLATVELDPEQGTVVIETTPRLQASPGLRFVRLHSLDDPGDLDRLLAPWKDRLQGVALAGGGLDGLETILRRLGATRIVAPGELQSPDASWTNGGLPALEVLAF